MFFDYIFFEKLLSFLGARFTRKMGGKKKRGEKGGGQKKRPLFQKPKKWGISKKKKKAKMGGDKKPRPFFKHGDAKNKNNGKTPCGYEKIQIICLKKKKMGRKWAQGENPPFSKNGRHKKKNGGGAHRFFDEKKSPIFLISLG